ncbi:MAG TPA: OmpA family protein [Chitinophagaceae bacterium]|nr:OmpA family protein [Chitinophagaceae bacterium]
MKPLHLLLIISFSTLVSYGQKTDTLVLFYKPDRFSISKQDKQRLDSFLLKGWDRISVLGYTDETDEEGYNLGLSKKRSDEVYRYFIAKNIASDRLSSQFFGESMPVADNSSDDGRALNRRTEIIGYQFARLSITPKVNIDPMKPVTKTLDNGFIITYQPGIMPASMLANFEAGSGMNFQLLTNTTQMRQNNLFNNTTRGEILSSVLIICGDQLKPCKLPRPIEIKVPIPFKTKCPIEKVKFFNAVAEKGKRIWQEETKTLYPEEIGGRQYIKIWLDDFCQCINFDFKVDPECFDTDSTRVYFVNSTIKNLSAELRGLNSVYLPRKINDSTHSILFIKDQLKNAVITFSLYNGRRWMKTFRDQQLAAFPYDETTKQYILSTAKLKFYFPKVKVYDVVLKVNNDRYKIAPEKKKYDFVYLNRQTETILIDFSTIDSRGRIIQYKDQPIGSLPYDEATGYRVINKKFIKTLKQTGSVAAL